MQKLTIVSLVLALLAVFGVGYLFVSGGANTTPSVPDSGGLATGHAETIPWSFVNGASFGNTGQSWFDKKGVSTVGGSYDGFILGNTSFTVASGTAKFVATNNSDADYMCYGGASSVFATSTLFAPTISFSLGTTTSATGYATNLMASTTIATTTSAMTGGVVKALTYTSSFILRKGESIVGALSDVYSSASSTYYSRWTIRPSFPCWLMGQ